MRTELNELLEAWRSKARLFAAAASGSPAGKYHMVVETLGYVWAKAVEGLEETIAKADKRTGAARGIIASAKHWCATCQNVATVNIEEIGLHFCASCLAKIDARIKELPGGGSGTEVYTGERLPGMIRQMKKEDFAHGF